MKVEGSALHTVSHASSTQNTNQAASLKQKQPQTPSRQGEVSSLASEGQRSNLPKNLSQRDTTPSGSDPAKQKHKKFSFKHMLGLKHGKSQTTGSPAASQASTSRPNDKQAASQPNANRPNEARPNVNNPPSADRARGKSFASRLAHGLGFKHSNLHNSPKPQTSTSSQPQTSTSAQPQTATPSSSSSSHTAPQRTTLASLFKEDPFDNHAAMGPSGKPFREHGEQSTTLSHATNIASQLTPEEPSSLSHEAQVDNDLASNNNQPSNDNHPASDNIPDNEEEEDPEVLAHLQAFQARNQRFGLATIPEGEHEGVEEEELATLSDSGHESDTSQQTLTNTPLRRTEGLAYHSASDLSELVTASSGSLPEAPQSSSETDSFVSAQETMLDGPIKGPEMRLDKGKVTFSEATHPALATLLSETLGDPAQSYVALESHQDNLQQLLLDKQGRLFQVSTEPHMGILALHSSAPILDAANPPSSLSQYVTTAGQDFIENGYRPIATGIHSDDSGNHWRVVDGHLHSFVELNELEELSGIRLWKQDEMAVAKLATVNDNVLGIQDKHQVVNLTTEQSSPTFEQDIQSYSVNQQGTTALLLKTDGASKLTLLPKLDANSDEAQEVELKHANPERRQDPVKLSEVHITHDRLFAIDKENNLLTAPLPRAGQSDVQLAELPQAELENVFGKDVTFEGFTQHKGGSLSLIVRDHHNHLHACPAIDESARTFKPGWNLSDTLNLNNTMGMDQFHDNSMREQNFGTLGSLAFVFDDGKLYSKDKLTQQWTKVADKVHSLQRAADGQAYAVQDGQLKKVQVDESSGKIGFGGDNVFRLSQTHGTTTLGSGPKGVPEGRIKAAAVIDPYQHVTLTESGKLQYNHIRPGTSTPMHPPRDISMAGLEGKIRHLCVDQQGTLFALTKVETNDPENPVIGKLFKLEKNDWQTLPQTPGAAQWQEETSELLSNHLEKASITLNSDFQLEIATHRNNKFTRTEEGWQESTASTTEGDSVRDKFFANLVRATKGVKVSKTGTHYNASASLFGVSGMENIKVSSKFTDRLKAHVFKPSLETPRPIKTAAQSLQHQWQGRQGLNDLYQQESALFKALEANNTDIKGGLLPSRPEMDVKARIEHLSLGPAGDSVKADLEAFRAQLEASAEKQLILLGREQGALLHNSSEPDPNYKPSKIKNGVQSFNPNRSGHSLSEAVLTSWQRNPASDNSKVTQLLTSFSDMKVNMSYQKTNIPAGRMRDPNDDMALSKARLVLDTLILQELDDFISKAEMFSGTDINDEQAHKLQKQLSNLRDGRYEKHLIKQYTDRSLMGHKDIEATYDMAKAFMKGFSDPEHGVSLITNAVFQNKSKDTASLNQNLKELLHSMKPNDSVSFARDYGAGVSATFIPTALQNKPLTMFPTAGVDTKRSYAMDINGLEDGIEIEFKGILTNGASGNFGITKDVLPYALGDDADKIPININDHQKFKPDLVAGAGLTINAGTGDFNHLKFNLRGESIDAFVDGLTNGKITPEQLIGIGMEHTNIHGNKWNFDVDLGLRFAARAQVQLTDDSDNPSVIVRAGGGVSANASLLSLKHDDLRYRSIEESRHRINRTDGVLNNASAGIDGALTLGVFHNKEEGGLVMYPNLASSASAAVDNSTKVRGELKAKPSTEVSASDMTSLHSKLSSAFQDPVSQQILKGSSELADINEQLKVLDDHFVSGKLADVKPKNDQQYAAIKELKTLQIQHLAASKSVEMMSDVKGVVAHFNPHHLDHGGVLNFLTSLIAPSKKDALSEQINGMMKDDPTFSAMINEIRTKPHAYTWVTLELKDDAKLKLSKDFVEGKITIEDARKLLADPDQRRIKSISILETGAYTEGFGSPTLFVGGSSKASVYMEREAGVINFSYGQDQDKPRNYTISGGFTETKQELASAIKDMKESQGLSLS